MPNTITRFYVGTGAQLPDAFRTDKGEPLLDFIEGAILFTLDAFDVPGATLYRATGVWQGAAEPTTVVEVLDINPDTAHAVASALRRKFTQDAILVTRQEVTVLFV